MIHPFGLPICYQSLKVHPYFWFHYTFRQVYLADEKFKSLWDSTPKISADIPHKPQLTGLLKPLNSEIKEEIDKKVSPVYKLTWKYDQSANIEGSIFDYILNLEKLRGDLLVWRIRTMRIWFGIILYEMR